MSLPVETYHLVPCALVHGLLLLRGQWYHTIYIYLQRTLPVVLKLSSLYNTRRPAGRRFLRALVDRLTTAVFLPYSSRHLTTKPGAGAPIHGAAASPEETNDSKESDDDSGRAAVGEGGGGGRCSLGEQQQPPLSPKEKLGGRGACRMTAPSIAPPKEKVSSDEEASERENAKRILRTLATHLWPSKELQVTLFIGLFHC